MAGQPQPDAADELARGGGMNAVRMMRDSSMVNLPPGEDEELRTSSSCSTPRVGDIPSPCSTPPLSPCSTTSSNTSASGSASSDELAHPFAAEDIDHKLPHFGQHAQNKSEDIGISPQASLQSMGLRELKAKALEMGVSKAHIKEAFKSALLDLIAVAHQPGQQLRERRTLPQEQQHCPRQKHSRSRKRRH
mmetsp:Transcript_97455/g.172600  ORF Transcript_97455/g.172600 Transcript_97455/m.172600 type:complete len:191 (-) Transcript_97455:252-824(-)